jgi:response regulator RpfG family c-di-GMP phosphodiesterase
MAEKILLVDDEPNVLDGYRRTLGREFALETSVGSQDALALIAKNGAYAVVVSDMRMPGMDGIQLLSRIKAVSPDTIRVMLTGHADMDTAVNAINEGSIFRFLNKPTTKEMMGKTLTAALVQYRLVTAEKQLLEQTLSGALQVLTEVLSLVNPAAFSRASRARRYMQHVATAMKVGNPWKYEVAAMLSQLGCVTLAPETVDAVYKGEALSAPEQAQYDAHPNVAYQLLSKIPRLEPIAWMIQHQNKPVSQSENTELPDMRRGAEILRLVLAYEQATHRGASRTEAARTLAGQSTEIGPEFVAALAALDPNAEEEQVKSCTIEELYPGMIIQEDVHSHSGTLLVSNGQEVTAALISKMKNFYARGSIDAHVQVSDARSTLSFAKGAS